MKLYSLVMLLSMVLSLVPAFANAQKESFDISSYTSPKGWIKKTANGAVQLSKEDATKGTFCMITLYKAVAGTADSKENFDLAWTSVVKEMITVSTDPEMQPPVKEDGWEVQSGYAPFESDGNKGIVLLVTSSGFDKMVNIIILTNTDAYEKDITRFIESISLKKPKEKTSSNQTSKKPATQIQTTQKPATQQPNKGGFAFTTTNFDDGWVATVQSDWVQVIKGNIKVLIHYPNKKVDTYNSVLLDGLKNAWDVLVAPRYSSARNMEFKPLSNWEPIEFAEADMVERATGKTVHVVLFKKNLSNGQGKYLEFITPDKRSFELEFGSYQQSVSGWEKMEAMAYYNKFAVSPADLKGKWTTQFSGALQYVNAYTGLDAGMNTHASNENFQFTGDSYKWDLGVASGMVGNIKFQSVKSTGKFSMAGNWQLKCSDIEGKPKTFNVHFSCIKGLRILWLDNRAFAKVE